MRKKLTDEERAERKAAKQCRRSRNMKENYPIFKNGFFNVEDPAPWGFNYLLGYCEQANNFSN